MKFYLRQQRMSRIINIKELNNILDLHDEEQEKGKSNCCNIVPTIENYEKGRKIFKNKGSIKKSQKSIKKSKKSSVTKIKKQNNIVKKIK